MASMTLVWLFATLCVCLEAAIEPKHPVIDIPIEKNLDSLNPVANVKAVVTLEAKLENVNESYHLYVKPNNVAIPDISSLKDLTVYLATEEQEIVEVIMNQGKMECKHWKKPWNIEKSIVLQNETISPFEANAIIEIPQEWIPKTVITGVSASIGGILNDNDVTLNYYELKNYMISLPDRYVVKNYLPVDLDVFFQP